MVRYPFLSPARISLWNRYAFSSLSISLEADRHCRLDSRMRIDSYYSDIVGELTRKAQSVADAFQSHRPSSGENKEELPADVLRQHLPTRFTVDTGLLMSCEGQFSREADLIVADGTNNAPPFPTA